MTEGLNRKEAIARLWDKGVLWWKLVSHQKDLYNSYFDSLAKTIVWQCGRRSGKSTVLLVIAIEMCLQKQHSIIKYVAPQQKMVRTIIRPIMRKLIADCPKHLRPTYSTQESAWKFPNGSEIQMAGTDNGNAENLRGGEAHLCIVDEAAFCEELEYIVNSILIPTMTTTNGKIILSSTPPITPDHDFVDYMEIAKAKGSFVQKTLDDNVLLTAEQKEEYINELGGRDSPIVQREYFCIHIVDSNRVVIPEFTKELQAQVIKEWPRPPLYDAYTSMDIGSKDLTAVVFAYLDFRNGRLVIEDEYYINGPEMTTDKLALNIKAKEKALWKSPFSLNSNDPYLRVADNNLILINDLYKLHKLTFVPTAKDNSDAALNEMRMMISSGKVIINPRCKVVIEHLQNATWNKGRTSYQRRMLDFKTSHHYDFVDAVKYLIRNVQWNKNPYPAGFDLPRGDRFIVTDPKKELTPMQQSFKDIYTVRPTIRRTKH